MDLERGAIVLEALSFAARKHEGQKRKDGQTPYSAHPSRVLTILATVFGVAEPDMLAAAALHDTIEDTTTDRDDLSAQFGERVADWVARLTKDKRLPEDERERAYFDGLEAGPLEVKLCKLADVVDNLLDSRHLSAERRREKIAQARELVERFAPSIPPEWGHVLDVVRRQIDATERI